MKSATFVPVLVSLWSVTRAGVSVRFSQARNWRPCVSTTFCASIMNGLWARSTACDTGAALYRFRRRDNLRCTEKGGHIYNGDKIPGSVQ